ncbi:MAG: hypothetical protein ACR2NF_03705 [Pirellulales bacterium]
MIVKTKGILDENGVKHFQLTDSSGDIYIAMRQPNGRFTIGDDGVNRTLKQCKDAVVNDAVVFFADATEAPESPNGGDTWSCVDPCALLIMLQAGVDVASDEIKRTLDAHGWLTPEGLTDVVQAEENLEKWSKR